MSPRLRRSHRRFRRQFLRRCLFWKGLGPGWRELEADEPFAGGAVAADFGRSKLPAARGFQSKVGEILTGAGRIERSLGDVARWIDVNPDADANDTPNGGARLLGDVRQSLVENFTARGRRSGSARRVCGWEDVGAHGSRNRDRKSTRLNSSHLVI